jgi:hypothetical protein
MVHGTVAGYYKPTRRVHTDDLDERFCLLRLGENGGVLSREIEEKILRAEAGG